MSTGMRKREHLGEYLTTIYCLKILPLFSFHVVPNSYAMILCPFLTVMQEIMPVKIKKGPKSHCS